MFLTSRNSNWMLVLAATLLLSAAGFSQDLGSSSGIFKAPNPSVKRTSPTTEKKTTTKTKSTTAKSTSSKHVVSKNTRPASKATTTAKVTKSANTSKTTLAKNTGDTGVKPVLIPVTKPQQNNIFINVGTPSTGNFEELFEQAIDEGNTARDNRNYVAAEAAYRRAQSLKKNDSRAIYGLGNIFSDQQRWEEAEFAYRQAISLEPNSPEAHIALSFVLTQPVLGTNLSDRYIEAETMARRAIAIDNGNAIAFDQLGVSLELRGFIDADTRDAYKHAIQIDNNFALAYAHLGRLLRKNGLINESSAAYRDAIRLATDVPTMILVADVLQSQQKFLESEQLLRRALNEDPRNPTALFLLGRALTIKGSFNEAELILKKSVEVSPNSFVSYAQLGSLYTRRNNFEEAEKTLMKALSVTSFNERKRLAQEFEIVGDGFIRTGKRKEAVRVYRQAFSLDQQKPGLVDKLNNAQRQL